MTLEIEAQMPDGFRTGRADRRWDGRTLTIRGSFENLVP